MALLTHIFAFKSALNLFEERVAEFLQSQAEVEDLYSTKPDFPILAELLEKLVNIKELVDRQEREWKFDLSPKLLAPTATTKATTTATIKEECPEEESSQAPAPERETEPEVEESDLVVVKMEQEFMEEVDALYPDEYEEEDESSEEYVQDPLSGIEGEVETDEWFSRSANGESSRTTLFPSNPSSSRSKRKQDFGTTRYRKDPQPSLYIKTPVSEDQKSLEEFAAQFRKRRTELGVSQGQVGLALEEIYGADFSQTTISRFEALNLSYKNMCKLKPFLQKWLLEKELEKNPDLAMIKGDPSELMDIDLGKVLHRRKRRTAFGKQAKLALEQRYSRNPRPSPGELEEMASLLNTEKEVVRVWFCNRRASDKRTRSDTGEQLSS